MNSPTLRSLASGVIALLLCSTSANAATLKADPAHTSATFSVKHLTLTTVSGTIQLKSAEITVGDNNMLTAADATLDLSTIDTHESRRDSDLKSEHWFEIAKYPDMTFKSTKVVPGTGGAMSIAGTLTFHGVTNPVTLAATYEGSVKDDRGRTHVGYTATGTIDRTAWNLGTSFPELVVGKDVTITIELEALET